MLPSLLTPAQHTLANAYYRFDSGGRESIVELGSISAHSCSRGHTTIPGQSIGKPFKLASNYSSTTGDFRLFKELRHSSANHSRLTSLLKALSTAFRIIYSSDLEAGLWGVTEALRRCNSVGSYPSFAVTNNS